MGDVQNDIDVGYADLVLVARASERVTPEGLEQVYGLSVWASDAETRRLVADGILEPGTLRPRDPLSPATNSEHRAMIQLARKRLARSRPW